MNHNTDQQEENLEKKSSKNQPTRKKQRSKKKYGRQGRIHKQIRFNKRNHPLKRIKSIQDTKDETLSMFQPYCMRKKCIPLNIGTNTDPTLLLSDYLTISNTNFKDMLLATVMANDFQTNTFIELLNNDEEILTYMRQLTVLMNKLNYYKLQQEQWTYYYQLGVTEGICNGRVSKAIGSNEFYVSYLWSIQSNCQTT
ncbi:unnamed protein product [Rotaria sp. Silwood2]|nr:unnamed protein product [Rotaria sp. Silwood2]CAF3183905.1 unnamed protein product [Rotaria sp. Silwood2]CAF4606607.1 unnamed protein product [Rotaria sp. Silwood2]